jgi:hypothetical protein
MGLLERGGVKQDVRFAARRKPILLSQKITGF